MRSGEAPDNCNQNKAKQSKKKSVTTTTRKELTDMKEGYDNTAAFYGQHMNICNRVQTKMCKYRFRVWRYNFFNGSDLEAYLMFKVEKKG